MILVKQIDGDSGYDVSENEIAIAHLLNQGGESFKSYDGTIILFDRDNILQVGKEFGLNMADSLPLSQYIFDYLIPDEILKFENGFYISKKDCYNAVSDTARVEHNIYNLDTISDIKDYIEELLNDHINAAFESLVNKISKQIKYAKFS